MNEINWLELGLSFLGGFGLFLFGMGFMGEGLQKAAGSKMKNVLSVLTSNRVLGVLVGAGITALIQSSSATTVMVVGFVNAGLMSLVQAVGVIMGANVGTTVTAWIVSLGEWTSFLKPSVLAPVFIVTGVVMLMFSKKSQTRHVGEILFGFGSLFLGLDMMSGAAKPLSKLEEVKNLFLMLGGNPLLGILVGAVVTAVIQSSSASVGILQALALAGLVPWSSAIYIILGQNIGTCVTAVLSSIGASQNAKRAAMIHFLFNFIGSALFGILAIVVFKFAIPTAGLALISVTEISVVHTIFNVLNTLVLFPFAGVLVYLAEHLIKDDQNEQSRLLQHLDERILETPSLAVENAIKEVIRMGRLAAENVKVALEALAEKDAQKIEQVFEKEKKIDKLQHGINQYLIKLSNVPLSEYESYVVTGLFHTVGDVERVGDHADNIAELAEALIEQGGMFSHEAEQDLAKITLATIECFEIALEAYRAGDTNKAQRTLVLEGKIDEMEAYMRLAHIKRLVDKRCEAVAGIIFLDTLSNVERIADHSSNIAKNLLRDPKTNNVLG
ncbi:MAG: Na/Pi cotransporter family protein [Cellulosilyticaceae bacterium]